MYLISWLLFLRAVLWAWMLYFEWEEDSLTLGLLFFSFRCKSPCLAPEVWNRGFKCSAQKKKKKRTARRGISQGCRRESGSSRHLVMFWPQCKSISAILLMNWSMIYTVSGARFLPPPRAKCWQRLSVFGRPFVFLWVSWFVLFILNSWSSLVVGW